MKIRHTETARREFDDAVDYLIKHAPAVAADFADSIENAEAELLRNPYSAQETELRGVRRKYIQRFRYGLFYMVDEKADELIIMNIRHAARRWPWEPRG
jgi:plasmid stabilization system protein ParE